MTAQAPINPLRLLLKESVLLKDDERTAFLKMVMVINRCSGNSFYDPDALFLAAAWEEQNGEPTWDRLGEFADAFAADLDNAACMATMLRMHEAHLGKLEDDYRDALLREAR